MFRVAISGHCTPLPNDSNSSALIAALEKLLLNTTIYSVQVSSYDEKILLRDMLTLGRALTKLKISSGATPSITRNLFRIFGFMKET